MSVGKGELVLGGGPGLQASEETPKRQVARHFIRTRLRKRILNGDWKPGSKLVQQRLAREFGVSMGLIREAILELQAWGLVEVIDNRGMFVSRWNAQKLLDSYEVREVLEGLATRRCCGRITPEQIQECRALIDKMFTVASAGDFDTAGSIDRKFHAKLVEIAGNSMLGQLAEHYRFVGKILLMKTDPEINRKAHSAIVDVVESNRPDEAERLAREHIRIGREHAEQLIASGDFEPHWLV